MKFYVSFQDFDHWGFRSVIRYYHSLEEATEAAVAFCDHTGTRAIVMEKDCGITGGDEFRGNYWK